MNFQEIEARYAALRQQLDRRQISPQAFQAAASQLRLQGPDGAWWQINAQDGSWMRWDGRGWAPAVPPQAMQSAPAAAPSRPALGAVPAPQPSRRPAPAPLPALPRTAKPRVAQKPPESLLDLGKLILRGMFKNFLVKLAFSFVTLLFVWFFHTYLLVGPNGGFAPGVSPLLDAILALQGRMASGTFFWGMLFGLISMGFGYLWQWGSSGTVKMVTSTPHWLVSSFKQTKLVSLPILAGNAALALVAGTLINNRLISLLFLLGCLGALIAQNGSLPALVARLAWSDTQRLLGGKRAYHSGWTGSAMIGLSLGFLGATIMPWVPWCGLGGAFFLLAIMVLTIFLLLAGKPKAGATLAVLLLALSLLTVPALADDGGWEEAGGTLVDWIKSQGAVQAILQGLPPAATATVLGWLGAVMGQSLGGIANIKVDDIAATLSTAQGLSNLSTNLGEINQQLIKDGYYVRNFFQGDPTLIVQGLHGLAGIIWDNTAGHLTGAKGITCEGYVDLTFDKVNTAVQQQFPGAKVQSILFEENSSVNPQGWGDTIDSFNSENHNLIKVTLPDGSEWAVDFHQHNSHVIDSRTPPLMRPWRDAQQEWIDYLGKNEFTESVVR